MTSSFCTRPAGGRSPKTGTAPGRQAGLPIPCTFQAAHSSTRASYWVDFFRWVTGCEIVQVEAKLANLVHKDIAVEDWGMATFTTDSGIIATLEASWTINAPRKSGPSPKQNSIVRLEVVGSRGEIIEQWFRTPGRAVLAAGAPDWVFERQSEEPFGPALPSPLDHLIDCLEHDRQPVATIRDARDSFVAALAAYESARTGGPIRLSWPR